MSEQKSYLQIFKSTAVFGFVQVYNILIGIIKSKFVALLLGPSGMGIMGLYTSAITLVSALTNFGLGQSAVRSISEANGDEDNEKISKIVSVLRRLVWITGLIGSFVMIIFSAQISKWTFGNKDYTVPIIWLSISVFLEAISSGQLAILQGMRKIQYLAKANLTGATLGLVVSIPLYYFFGVKGIVPAIIATSVVTLLRSWYFAKKLKYEKVNLDREFTIREGKLMLRLGIMLSLSSIMTMITGYLVRIYIGRTGGLNEVGLFQAGWAIINGYIGMIFAAMSVDYYPRLAAVNKDNLKIEVLVNQQSVIAILLLAPLLTVFFIFNNYVILLLYSDKFIGIKYFLLYAMLGMLFKSTNWAMSYIFLAKNDSRSFFILELITNLYMCSLYILGYYWFGLKGMGLAIIVGNFIRIALIFPFLRKRYNFRFNKDFFIAMAITTLLLTLCFIIILFSKGAWYYLLGTLVIAISCYFSFNQLEKKMNLSLLIKNKLTKFRNHN